MIYSIFSLSLKKKLLGKEIRSMCSSSLVVDIIIVVIIIVRDPHNTNLGGDDGRKTENDGGCT